MTSARFIVVGVMVGVLAGCQVLHADLSDSEMEAVVRARFESQMPKGDVRGRLHGMSWVDVSDMEDGDLRALVWPKKFLVFGGLLDYYGTEILLFRFDSSDGLERVVYRPGDDPYVIDLCEEVTP